MSFATVVASAMLTVIYGQLLVTTVTIDGTPWRLRAGATAGDVLGAGLIRSRAGDLVSVEGSVLTTGSGEPVSLWREGEKLRLTTPLRYGDEIVSRSGGDVREATLTLSTAVVQPTIMRGSGPFVRVVRKGSPGVVELTMGEVSRSVIESRTLVEPVAMVVMRSTPDAPKKMVALTFDDGPWPYSTDAVLRVLQREKVKASFFTIGTQAQRYPAMVRRIAREGHLVENHTMRHRKLVGASIGRTGVRDEIQREQRLVRSLVKRMPQWFRPPGGHVNGVIVDEARRAGTRLVLWDVDPQDWRRPGAGAIVERVCGNVRPGSVVLLHDGGGNRTQTVQSLTWIIRRLKAEGYTFVTLDQLAAAE